MKKINSIRATVLSIALFAVCGSAALAQASKPAVTKKTVVPSPMLEWKKFDADAKGSDGKPYVGITFGITNWKSFPDAMFAAAPDLPACGLNKNASRSWLDIFDAATGKRIYGFCTFSKSAQLNRLSFNVKRENLPDCIYVSLTDREAKKTVKSNLIRTAGGDNARCVTKPQTIID